MRFKYRYIVMFLCLFVSGIRAVEVSKSDLEIENNIVYQEEGKFCGWPANEGVWSWGNEILVGFEISSFSKNAKGHSIDRNSPKYIYFARSLDGGENWKVEKPKEILPPLYMEDPDMFKFGENKNSYLREHIDFTNPQFAMKLRANRFYYSYDKGESWKGPFLLPDFGQKLIMARTDYIVLSSTKCIAFISSSQTDGHYGESFGILTEDGGLTWNKKSLIDNKFPPKEYKKWAYSIMPSTVMLDSGDFVTTLRQRGDRGMWIDAYLSKDQGDSWCKLGKVCERAKNPPSLVKLHDGRLCIVYCYRVDKPYGLRAKISEDNGKSWGDEIILRSDSLSWDIGYVRSVQRPDGKVVSMYYYHTKKNPEQHIAATIWRP